MDFIPLQAGEQASRLRSDTHNSRSSSGRVLNQLALAVTFLVLADAAMAQQLRSTTSFTCRDAAALVASSGSVVLSTSAHTYERFVAGNGCGRVALEPPAYAATEDSAQCFIGYRCKEKG